MAELKAARQGGNHALGDLLEFFEPSLRPLPQCISNVLLGGPEHLR